MVKRKSPTSEPQIYKKLKTSNEKFKDKEKMLEGLLESFENSVEKTKQMLKKLREEKRQSLRPPPISIPVTPKYSGASPQYENFITAPQQLIEAPDGSVTSKRVFPDGSEVITVTTMYSDSTMDGGVIRTDEDGECYIDPEAKPVDLTDDEEIEWQAHSPNEPNFCGSPRINTPFSPLFSDLRASPTWSCKPLIYNGMSGKLLAIYTDKVIKIQAMVRGGLARRKKKKKWRPSIVKMQAVVRGGLVRMRRWREKKKETVKILMKGIVPLQALVRRFLVRMRMYNFTITILENKNATAIKIQALARRFLVRMRVWNVRSTNPEFASAMKSAVRGWLLGERKPCTKHDLKPVRSGYDHTTYECRNCDYESGCV